ncbi:hypothetical protein K1719_002373 [Acacia pycnantha]|nr:hypothetical protein K1719_002373 [Acacia pycnantha]
MHVFEIKIGFTFPGLPEPVRSTTDYPTLVRELINRNRDLEDQLEQLQKQLQQLKGVTVNMEHIKGKDNTEQINYLGLYLIALPLTLQKFEMNKGKTSVKSEQGDSSEPTKEIMTFGSTVLVKYSPGHSKAFKPLPHLPTPDESQQCLLDALWNASTAKQKHTALNALNFYFSKILEKPLSKNFSFYVLFERRKARIYINYPELVKAIEIALGPSRRGFYSFQEARNRATRSLPPPIFVEGKSIAELPPQIEGLTEPQCDKFLRDARLYESLGNKYAEDYNSLSFDTVVKKSCYRAPRLGSSRVLDPDPENYGDDGMFDDEYMADTD